MAAIIYKITNLVNGKWYIGKDSHNNPKYLGSGLLIIKAVKKYGKENFNKEVLEILPENATHSDLNLAEISWISKTNAANDRMSYNLTYGGDGVIPTDKTRAKIAKINRKNATNEDRNRKLSVANKEFQKNNPGINKERFKSAFLKNPLLRDEMAIKQGARRFFVIGIASKEIVWDGFSRRRCALELGLDSRTIWDCLKGISHSHYGYYFRYEGSEHLPLTKKPSGGPKKKIKNVDTGEIFSSISYAARKLGLHPGSMANAVRAGKGFGGYSWERV